MVTKWTFPPCYLIDVPYAQQQNGDSDCGLFAIAFAVHLALGDDVAGLNFNQSKMRQHLMKCFQQKTMMPFPQTKTGPRHQTYLNCFALVRCQKHTTIWLSVTRVGTGSTSSLWVYSNFQQKANNETVLNVSSYCIVILVYD